MNASGLRNGHPDQGQTGEVLEKLTCQAVALTVEMREACATSPLDGESIAERVAASVAIGQTVKLVAGTFAEVIPVGWSAESSPLRAQYHALAGALIELSKELTLYGRSLGHGRKGHFAIEATAIALDVRAAFLSIMAQTAPG